MPRGLYGNIFVTAHKENWQLALAPDLNSPTFTRSMSWAWASSDGGQTFADLPGLTMLSLEQHDVGDEGDMAVDDANHLYYGKTWSHKDVTPMNGHYEYGWLSVSPDGKKLGLGVYYRPDTSSDWHVYGAVFRAGGKPGLVQLDPVSVQDGHCAEAPGDLLESAFNSDGTLSVVWTRNTDATTCGLVTVGDVYFARSQ